MFRTFAVGAAFVTAAALVLAFAAHPASAHHAFAAEFDASKPVKFEKAVVKKMEWVNPHVWIHIEVPLADGKAEPLKPVRRTSCSAVGSPKRTCCPEP